MLPIRNAHCNFTYTAPPSRPDCQDLPCMTHAEGTTSFWQPDPEELKALVLGGSVMFTHFGAGHPVIGLGVHPPDGVQHPGG